jgi:hypothetical protein
MRHQPSIYVLTAHALNRMDGRRLSTEAVRFALTYGRSSWTRGAKIYAIGRKEVERWRGTGVNLAAFEGVHVVTAGDGAILSVYRTRDLRGLRQDKRPRFAAEFNRTKQPYRRTIRC